MVHSRAYSATHQAASLSEQWKRRWGAGQTSSYEEGLVETWPESVRREVSSPAEGSSSLMASYRHSKKVILCKQCQSMSLRQEKLVIRTPASRQHVDTHSASPVQCEVRG